MKKVDPSRLPEDHIGRYDWAKSVRGRFAGRAAKASLLLRILEPDVARRFPDSRSVNDALRALLGLEEALPRRRTRRRHAA